MDGFEIEMMRRLPLAQAVLRLFGYTFSDDFLNSIYEGGRGRGYEREVTFPRMFQLVHDALLIHHGSARQCFDQAAREGRLGISRQNAYAKLGRLGLEISIALVLEGSQRLLPVLSSDGDGVLPPSLRAMTVLALDGKKIKNAAKRLKPLRGKAGAMLGGKVLVAMSIQSGLAMAMNADPDGQRNDVPLVPDLVGSLRRRWKDQSFLWIADRQFASLELFDLLCQPPDHFLIRAGTTLSFEADPRRPSQEGVDERGHRWVQQWGTVGSAKRRYVRRITLFRPGQEDVMLVTDLLEEQQTPAVDLLWAYLQRWGIERMFQQVTEVMDLQHLIGSSPQAMIFQSAMCFQLYNVIQVIKRFIATDARKAVEEVSTELLFRDIRQELQTWTYMMDTPQPIAPQVPDDAAALRQWVQKLVAGKWTDKWLKAPPQKRRPQARTRVPKGHCGHHSVWQILQQAKKERRP